MQLEALGSLVSVPSCMLMLSRLSSGIVQEITYIILYLY